MSELAEKENKRVIITVFYLFKYSIKLTKDEDMKDVKKIKIGFLEMETAMSELKNTVDRIKQKI